MSIPSNLIINADDFGYSESKNIAILECFYRGKINSTSIMANMANFYQAVKWIKKSGFDGRVGLHACLTEGKALTNLSETGFVDKEGFFIKKRIYKHYIIPKKKTRLLIQGEIKAQLAALYTNNIIPTHINSHHHIHTLPWISPIFKQIAKDFNLKIRIAQTWNDNKNPAVPFYRHFLNRSYKRDNINFSDYFETIKSSKEKLTKLKKTSMMEIMVHPDLNNHSQVYDCIDNMTL